MITATRTELIADLREASEDSMVDYCFDGRPMRDLILKSANMLEADAFEITEAISEERGAQAALNIAHEQYEKLQAAARLALSVLQGCLDHPDADDAIAALEGSLK
jgi:hypothetical protein